MGVQDRDEELARLEQQLADLLGRWPAHSVPPSLWQEREELEERIVNLKRETGAAS